MASARPHVVVRPADELLILVQEDIARLQIAMQNALAVGVNQSDGN